MKKRKQRITVTADLVRAVTQDLKDGLTRRQVRLKHDLSHGTVSRIARGQFKRLLSPKLPRLPAGYKKPVVDHYATIGAAVTGCGSIIGDLEPAHRKTVVRMLCQLFEVAL